MEPQMLGLVILLVCACVTSSIPPSSRRADLSNLFSLLGKLKDIERVRQNSNIANWDSKTVSDFPDSEDAEEDPLEDDDDSLSKNFPERRTNGAVNKRQGAWSYDYGLGGGRFGKRNYGDYGIGGGRFGRDVDHVDPSDGSEVDMTS